MAAPSSADDAAPATGTSLLAVVKERYGDDDDDTDYGGLMFIRQGVEQLRTVTLPRKGISNVGDAAALGVKLPRLTDVDVSENKMHGLHHLHELCAVAPRLRFLNASRNPLGAGSAAGATGSWTAAGASSLLVGSDGKAGDDSDGKHALEDALPAAAPGKGVTATFPESAAACLATLVLNGTGIEWASVHDIVSALPNLSELALASNAYTHAHLGVAGSPPLVHGKLATLRLEDNNVAQWEAVVHATSGLSSLDALVLSGNPLTVLWYPDDGGRERRAARGDGDDSGGAERLSDGNDEPEEDDGVGEAKDGAEGKATGSDGKEAPATDDAAVSDTDGDAGATARSPHSFAVLRSLILNNTGLQHWADVDELGLFPSLRELSTQGSRLGADLEPDVRRMLTIARLPNISAGGHGHQTVGSETAGRLNKSPITSGERRAAIQFYDRWRSGAWAAFRAESAASYREQGASAADAEALHKRVLDASAHSYMRGGLASGVPLPMAAEREKTWDVFAAVSADAGAFDALDKADQDALVRRVDKLGAGVGGSAGAASADTELARFEAWMNERSMAAFNATEAGARAAATVAVSASGRGGGAAASSPLVAGRVESKDADEASPAPPHAPGPVATTAAPAVVGGSPAPALPGAAVRDAAAMAPFGSPVPSRSVVAARGPSATAQAAAEALKALDSAQRTTSSGGSASGGGGDASAAVRGSGAVARASGSVGSASSDRARLASGAGPADTPGARLLIAAERGDESALAAALKDCGGDVDGHRGMNSYSALHHACARAHARCVALLLDAGASPSRLTDDGETCLHCAAFGSDDAGIASALLARSANPNAANAHGDTALMLAARRGHAAVVRVLVEAGADKAARNRFGDTAGDDAKTDAVRAALHS